ncbi:MAG: hypothetical protein ACYDEA_07050 [Candidatus Dormibacteria bacterium]
MRKVEFTFPQARGRYSQLAHGGVLAGTIEEQFARQGFCGPASHHIPRPRAHGVAAHRGPAPAPCLRPGQVAAAEAAGGMTPVLGNQDGRIQISRRTPAMPHCHRSPGSDLICLIHRGSGEMPSDLGRLLCDPGESALLPRGTRHRISPLGQAEFPAGDRQGTKTHHDEVVVMINAWLPLHPQEAASAAEIAESWMPHLDGD